MELTLVILPLLSSATSNSILDRAIDSEESQHKDFLRLVRQITLVFMRIFLYEIFWIIWQDSDIWFYTILKEHVEGYHELSAKTKIFFSTAVAKWDADFYVKVDDDVHVNLGICYLRNGFSSFLCFLSIVSFTTFLYFPKRNLYSNIC